MKPFLVIIFTLLFVTGWAQQKKAPVKSKKEETALQKPLSSKKVPQVVLKKFAAAYPNASVNGWYLENDHFYKVVFRDPPTLQQLIVYDTTGQVVRRETELDNRDVPDTISGYHRQNFPKEDYSVWKRNDGDKVTYYSAIEGYTVYFDEKGRFIRREPRHQQVRQ